MSGYFATCSTAEVPIVYMTYVPQNGDARSATLEALHFSSCIFVTVIHSKSSPVMKWSEQTYTYFTECLGAHAALVRGSFLLQALAHSFLLSGCFSNDGNTKKRWVCFPFSSFTECLLLHE